MFRTPEFKVGLLVIVVTSIIAVLTMKVNDGPGLFSRQKGYWFLMKNAGGLVPNSAVFMAGIRVGQIKSIHLKNGKAKISVVIDEDLSFTKEGYVQIRPQGLLGDKIVELYPGPEGVEELPDGSQILSASDKGSIDDVVGEVGEIAKSLGDLAKVISNASGSNGDSTTPLGRIILNIEEATRDLAQMTRQNKDKVGEVMDNLNEMIKTLDEIVNDQGDKGLKVTWNKAVDSVDKLNSAMGHLSEASRKLNSTDGTLGRLINDDEILVKVETTMDQVTEFLGGASELETSIGYHAEYLSKAAYTKSFIDFKIQPGLDRYYLIQIIEDPTGVSSNTETTTIVDNGTPTLEDKTVLNHSSLKFSIQFAKNFYDFTLRGGVIENSGGVGFDYYFLRNKLRWSLEMSKFDDLYLKSYLKYDVWKGVFLIGGAENITDATNMNSFVGAGLFITNDDLKLFASKVSF